MSHYFLSVTSLLAVLMLLCANKEVNKKICACPGTILCFCMCIADVYIGRQGRWWVRGGRGGVMCVGVGGVGGGSHWFIHIVQVQELLVPWVLFFVLSVVIWLGVYLLINLIYLIIYLFIHSSTHTLFIYVFLLFTHSIIYSFIN